MKIYCLCGLGGSAANRVVDDRYSSYLVRTATPVKCIKTGSQRILADGQEYSNVDVFECPNCNTIIAKG